MRIGVEVTGHADLMQVRMRELLGEAGEVVIDPGDRRNLADLHAAYSLAGEDLVSRVRVDHARNQYVRKCGESSAKSCRVSGFSPVI